MILRIIAAHTSCCYKVILSHSHSDLSSIYLISILNNSAVGIVERAAAIIS